MLITRYNADSERWEVYDTDDNIVLCDVGTQAVARKIIKDYNERNIK